MYKRGEPLAILHSGLRVVPFTEKRQKNVLN